MILIMGSCIEFLHAITPSELLGGVVHSFMDLCRNVKLVITTVFSSKDDQATTSRGRDG